MMHMAADPGGRLGEHGYGLLFCSAVFAYRSRECRYLGLAYLKIFMVVGGFDELLLACTYVSSRSSASPKCISISIPETSINAVTNDRDIPHTSATYLEPNSLLDPQQSQQSSLSC
jgi:hypothetical protein